MSVRYLSTILAQFATNVEAVDTASSQDGTLTASGYRYTLDKEPDSGMDGKYFLSVTDVTPRERYWGTGEYITDGHVVVQLSYFRGGGDAGGGDRQTVMRHAADDCQQIADICENPENYNSSVTGLRQVLYQGSTKIHDLSKAEVWEVRFFVQWLSDIANVTVSTSSQGGGVGLMHISGEYEVVSVIAGDEGVIGDPVIVNFDDFTFSTVKLRLTGYSKVSAGTGTYRIRLGGTVGAADGTEVASFTDTGTSYSDNDGVGTGITLPSGDQLLQITLANATANESAFLKGTTIAISDGSL